MSAVTLITASLRTGHRALEGLEATSTRRPRLRLLRDGAGFGFGSPVCRGALEEGAGWVVGQVEGADVWDAAQRIGATGTSRELEAGITKPPGEAL
jgi:hypothetical protein